MSETKPKYGIAKHVNSLSYINNYDTHNIYSYVSDCYKGINVERFLVLHEKETDIKKRYAITKYNNYIKGIVDSLITPVFSKPAIRQTNNILFENFLLNCDAKGNDIQKFSENVVKIVRTQGVCFIVMDNFSNIPETLDEAIKNRVFPYIYYVEPEDVLEYEVDDFGILKSLTFESGCDEVTYISDTTIKLGYLDDKNEIIFTEENEHMLGFIPIISIYDSLDNDILPIPPIKGLCDIAIQIYNQGSELRVLERNSCFSILTIDTAGEEHDINLSIGSASVLTYGSRDKTVNAPSWISPSAETFKTMMDSIDRSLNQLKQASSLIGVNILSDDSSTSGDHLSWKYVGTSYAIKHTARLAEEFEILISELFGKWVNNNIDYLVRYSDTYLPSNIEIENKLVIFEKLLAMDMSEEFKNKIKDTILNDIYTIYNIE